MAQIRIPDSPRRKALFVIDIQPATFAEKAKLLVPKIAAFIARSEYDVYVEANYFADKQSMFFKQGGFFLSQEEADITAPEVTLCLAEKRKPHFFVNKNTRSCFKAPNAAELLDFLNKNSVEEIHFVGFDINDCVLASAYEAIDLGYFSYVIGELCHHWEANENLKEAALSIFRQQSMLSGEENVRIISI